jgi:hypothetical protein
VYNAAIMQEPTPPSNKTTVPIPSKSNTQVSGVDKSKGWLARHFSWKEFASSATAIFVEALAMLFGTWPLFLFAFLGFAITPWLYIQEHHPTMLPSKRKKILAIGTIVSLALTVGIPLAWNYSKGAVEIVKPTPTPGVAAKLEPIPSVVGQAAPPPTKPTKSPIQKQSGKGNSQAGPITTGPCSNVQVGGSNNTATTNCALPSRVLTDAKAKQLTTDFSGIHPLTIWVFQAGASDDVQPVFLQFCNAIRDAAWHPNCQGLNGMSVSGPEFRTSIVKGIQCFSGSWDTGTPALVKAALDNAGFGCSYINHPFTSGGVTLGQIAILIGTRPAS